MRSRVDPLGDRRGATRRHGPPYYGTSKPSDLEGLRKLAPHHPRTTIRLSNISTIPPFSRLDRYKHARLGGLPRKLSPKSVPHSLDPDKFKSQRSSRRRSHSHFPGLRLHELDAFGCRVFLPQGSVYLRLVRRRPLKPLPCTTAAGTADARSSV